VCNHLPRDVAAVRARQDDVGQHQVYRTVVRIGGRQRLRLVLRRGRRSTRNDIDEVTNDANRDRSRTDIGVSREFERRGALDERAKNAGRLATAWNLAPARPYTGNLFLV
jgi:hypothetical protein